MGNFLLFKMHYPCIVLKFSHYVGLFRISVTLSFPAKFRRHKPSALPAADYDEDPRVSDDIKTYSRVTQPHTEEKKIQVGFVFVCFHRKGLVGWWDGAG